MIEQGWTANIIVIIFLIAIGFFCFGVGVIEIFELLKRIYRRVTKR